MVSEYLLRSEGISKFFPGVKALSNVSFTLKQGEIHSIMGENGAGKSTLIKVFTGVHKMDEGSIFFKEEQIDLDSPQSAQNKGISAVFQEVNLCENLSVAENIFIGREPKKNGRINWKEIKKRAEQLLLTRLNIKIDVSKVLSSYSTAIQQMIAIARAVDMSSGVLILDEPTSSLDKNEVKQLFKVMKSLKEEGMGIIFVSHFLEQVYEISDRITVLRNGQYIGDYVTNQLPRKDLVSNMIGREWDENSNHKEKQFKNLKSSELLLSGTNLARKGSINPLNIEMRKGEVLGLAGLLGSGRTELAKVIFGIDKPDQGVLYLNNEKIGSLNPKSSIERGVSFCPEDRKVEGIINDLTIRENIILGLQTKKGLLKYIPMKEQERIANKYIKLLRIKTPSIEQSIDNLSGGNQQKVILARWLATNPTLLILDEPTRGIDVGSKQEIRQLIFDLAKEGITILFISAELEETVACCDRVIVLRDRQKIGELQGEDMTESKIMDMIAKGDEIDETIPS
ncbi:monosaccharide ABC transporter ATP-binding protein, CUT2 family (TC 3.A.1.2.-) [Gracilibacillus orientalis]|uniref:Monosaccharide ABC transporter ATP-binding protein, CUT2 family (TC 3.A.1.2.-) n=2 Tax=Gracilibacillus orientalis TaxID=334253 RepID=A0A1I4HVM2_9BACI|nr:sugar ABC transporter ATP-binding protein [Gracilibacillus orientalis]SFL45890.1 monosaccharide ABC transporter ATP-binding protein, CUT2 family (TC 3.A.1.2.-) [Gracilibacillus orientalis]